MNKKKESQTKPTSTISSTSASDAHQWYSAWALYQQKRPEVGSVIKELMVMDRLPTEDSGQGQVWYSWYDVIPDSGDSDSFYRIIR